MVMEKKQSQVNSDPKNPNAGKERVWVSCRAKSAMGLAGEGGCGGQEAFVVSRSQTNSGMHIIVYQCVRCGRSHSTSY